MHTHSHMYACTHMYTCTRPHSHVHPHTLCLPLCHAPSPLSLRPNSLLARVHYRNGHKQDSATVAVTVYRASGSLDMSWHSSENLGEHQSHYETLVEEMAGGVLREALNLTKRTLFIEDVWVYEQEATVFGKVYYVGKGETDEEFFSRAESALRTAAEGGTTALNLLLPGGRTLTPMANSISVYRDSDIDWYGGDDDWWLWSSTAAVSTTAGSPSHSGSSGGPNNAAAIAVPVSLAIVALVGGVYYYVSRRPFGRTVQCASGVGEMEGDGGRRKGVGSRGRER